MHGLSALPSASGVYRITNTADRRVYIGSSVGIRRRVGLHRADLRAGRHHNTYLQRAWDKYGEEAFSVDVLELTAGDLLSLRRAEERWIHELRAHERNSGYNLDLRVTQGPGKLSEETKKKLSVAHKGKKHSPEHIQKVADANRGQHRPPSVGARIAAALRGRPRSEATKQKLREAHLGKKLSPEQAEKLRAGRKAWVPTEAYRQRQSSKNRDRVWSEESRKKLGESHAKTYTLLSPDGELVEVFNMRQFCRDHFLNSGAMSQVALGNKSQHKGWRLAPAASQKD